MWKKINVEIKGVGEGLLMHSCHNMGAKEVKKGVKTYDNKEEAEKVAYRNDKGQLVIPARCLKKTILNASSFYKFGKRSAKTIIAGASRIEPKDIPLRDLKGKILTKYEIDVRPVVVQKNRIMRARPLLQEWIAQFELYFDDAYLDSPERLREILIDGGVRVGLLDNRPQKFGENGRFEITKFELEE